MADKVDEIVKRARVSKSYLVAAFRFEDGAIHLDRACHDFPIDQFSTAMELLKENLSEELGRSGLSFETPKSPPPLTVKPPSSLTAKKG